jgi:hypothetical protein
MRLVAHVLLVAAFFSPFTSAHYYGYCISPGPSVPNTLRDSDPITVWINSNHGSFDNSCFSNYQNQARVDILDPNGNVVKVVMDGVQHSPNGGNTAGTFGYLDPKSTSGQSAKYWSYGRNQKPDTHCSAGIANYWFKIGPFYIPQDANYDSEVLKLKIWGIGCQPSDFTSAVLDFQPMDTTPCPAGKIKIINNNQI